MPNKPLLAAVLVVGGVATMATLIAAAPSVRRSWFLHRVAREVSGERVRPLRGRLDFLPYAPETLTEHRNTGLASMVAKAPDPLSRGLALLLSGRSESAIDVLQRVDGADHQSTAVWNALALAHLEHSLATNDAEELVVALQAADRAVLGSGNSAEANFNRAVVLESLGLNQAAARAYHQTLLLDEPSSPWAAEARERFRRCARSTSAEGWKADRERLVRAARAGEQSAVEAIVARYPQESRTWSEGVDLSEWAARRKSGKDDPAEPLARARAVGDALRRLNGEELLADAVAAIDRAMKSENEKASDSIAAAHVAYRSARMLYSPEQRRVADALPLFVESRDLFRSGGSPMALLAEYYHASAIFEQNETAVALKVVRAIEPPPKYKSLNALIDWFTGTATGNSGHFYESYEAYRSALRRFENLGEDQNAMRMRTEIAFTLSFLGRSPEAWRMRRTIFQRASMTGDSLLIQKTISTAAFDEVREKEWSQAASLYRLLTEAPELRSEMLHVDALIWQALAEDRLGIDEQSAAHVSEARRTISRMRDKEMADSAFHDLRLIQGLIAARHDPKAARRPLSDYISYSETHGKTVSLTDALLERARAARSAGDAEAATADLSLAVSLIEARRGQVASVSLRDTFFGTTSAVYDELADLQDIDGQAEAAFATLERGRARAILDRLSAKVATPPPLSDLRHRMDGGRTVVTYASLPGRLLIFVLRKDDFRRVTVAVSRDQLKEASRRFVDSTRRDDRPQALRDANLLYRWLIAPIASDLRRTTILVIVPDETLAPVPFAMLRSDTDRYLVEDVQVVTAPSASVFDRVSNRSTAARHVVLTVGNPSLDRSANPSLEPLPEAEAEAVAIARTYDSGIALTGSAATPDRFFEAARHAEVLHLATHAMVNNRDPWLSALVLAPNGSDSGLLDLSRIASASFDHVDTVILAGCRTGVAAVGPGAIRSLAAAFLAAGARSVIGTLWDVDDAGSREFSSRLHQRLRAGDPPAVALRDTQIAMIRSNDPLLVQPRTWGAFELIGSAQ